MMLVMGRREKTDEFIAWRGKLPRFFLELKKSSARMWGRFNSVLGSRPEQQEKGNVHVSEIL